MAFAAPFFAGVAVVGLIAAGRFRRATWCTW
jgi:hypothetical protein